MPTASRPHDIVLFGATSFVGRILVQRFVERHGTKGALRWAIAGRDADKLERIARETGADVPRLAVDADDDAALADPYALAPAGDRNGVSQPNVTLPEHDAGLGSWTAPFVMAATNTRVVFRTHALLGHPWGPDFTYGESTLTGDGLAGRAKAVALTAALGGFAGLAGVAPARAALARVLPKPGEGPNAERRETGSYDLRFHGTTASGRTIATRVTGDRDPGYGSTSKVLAEAATVLRDSDVAGGFWTPATALGAPYLDALEVHAGLAFEAL